MKKHLLYFVFLLILITQVKAQKPVANFNASKDTVCSGDCISFADSSSNNPTSWQWTFTGAFPPTSSDQNPPTVCYFDSGSYDVKLVVSNSSGSDSITKNITVFNQPPTPIIIQSGDTLIFPIDSNACYKWNFDSLHVHLDSLHKRFYWIVDTCGNLNFAVTDTCTGCSISVGINISCDGIHNLIDENAISVYPTPATNQLTIKSSRYYEGYLAISIMNVLGDMVQEEKLNWSNNLSLNISNLHPGIYFLQLQSTHARVLRRFVKE